MHFEENEIYHIYNRGNQKQPIFHSRDNYLYFLKKVKKYIVPRCILLNWTLMPNHFHFLVKASNVSVKQVTNSKIPSQFLTEGIRQLLSSYTKGINNEFGLKGNLFQQKTKAKCTSLETKINNGNVILDYSTIAFHYIHQNPWKAGLVSRIEDWEFSSFRDYCGFRKGNLCNMKVGFEELNIDRETIYDDSYNTIDPDDLKIIF